MSQERERERALSLVRERGGDELVERLLHLDGLARPTLRAADAVPLATPRDDDAVDVDVVFAGGGLYSILAPVLAARGLSVAVLERARAATAHREWNASEAELRALVDCGFIDDAGLQALIVARYAYGTCRFAGGGDHRVRGVLDRAVDAGALLEHGRARGEALGVRYLDHARVTGHTASDRRVRVGFVQGEQTRALTARVLIDARGAASPFATADLVCPTVGGVMTGFREGDGPREVRADVGDILATVDGVDAGRQHVWEGFPGRPGETTVYLFYYAHANERPSLVDLYARFFTTLADYKEGDARLLRPTFGLIPGWSRLSPAPAAPPGPIVLVGDAAARHSPLTYCGFGAALRSIAPVTTRVLRVAEDGARAARGVAVDDRPVHALTGALAQMMASRAFSGDALNALLDAAFQTLAEMGEDRYAALLRDEMGPRDFLEFLRTTAARHPAVWGKVWRGIGPITATRWGAGLVRSAWSASA